MYQPREIEDFCSAWRTFYLENDDRGESCIRYVYGDQWPEEIKQERALRGEESFSFNIAHNYLLHFKGEASSLDLTLKINADNQDPKLIKEGRHVMKRLILYNDHMAAFEKVLNQVYEHGYGVLLVTSRQCAPNSPSEEPFLQVIDDPKKAFFDLSCADDCKTEGRYCGLKYEIPYCEIFSNKKECSKESCEVIDFWYRDSTIETWYLVNGKWTTVKESQATITKKVQNKKVKFIRLVDGKIHQGPLDYYTLDKLPLVYWKGIEGKFRLDGARNTWKTKTIPFVYNLVDIQNYINYSGSAIVSRLKKLGGKKVIVSSPMIEGKENFWSDFLRRSGVLQVNENDAGAFQQPFIIPEDQVDTSLINAFQMGLGVIEKLAGVNPAQQGRQEQIATNAGLHRQIMQGNVLQKLLLSNHLHAINEVGKILKQMIPSVIVEQRNIGQGLVINKKTERHTPSNPEIINDIKTLFSELDFSIEYGTSSEAEKAANLMAIKELMSTNPNMAPYFADEFASNLNTSNSDKLKRRMEALMPPGIQKVGEGEMSIEEYQHMQQSQAQEEQKQPSYEQQKLELEKQKIEGDQQLKQADLQLKAKKLEHQGAKDVQNLKIKEAGVIAKMEPKEMIYEKEKGAS